MYIEKFVINRETIDWLEPTTVKRPKPARNRDRFQDYRYNVTEPDIAMPALATWAEHELTGLSRFRRRKG
ncbi:MAG: hypothetical protein KZQ88_14935 [Candidatus Thiodiazotropha sp. (ex Dulcina madagascariensis)]|nr:hypothetical protein [Candidatus Thiodiazotropha sp. (ex Epidulcina cf. delphinae)]MCU7923982.1 hypothetical protein [Candidatus Thiodiazotropha sp. (ex Dulcina madagascariensis)]MCU7928592.1 hypothetical protein [Candidatus Thiodiazotropha sp. (ex Dulcina madagascariensis)]